MTWQIIPTILIEMLNDADPRKSQRVMQTMMKMKKIGIAALRKVTEQ